MKESMCLTDRMLDVLGSLKGKTLKSYEADLAGYKAVEAWQVVVLHTGSVRVPVIRQGDCELFGELAGYAPLECFALEPGVPYYHTDYLTSKHYLVGERITSVEVVRDTATWSNPDMQEDDVLEEDAAIVVRTPGHVLTLSAYGSESILAQLVDLPDADPRVTPVEEYWKASLEEDAFTVERRTITL